MLRSLHHFLSLGAPLLISCFPCALVSSPSACAVSAWLLTLWPLAPHRSLLPGWCLLPPFFHGACQSYCSLTSDWVRTALCAVRDLAAPGDLTTQVALPFEFGAVEMQYESYRGSQVLYCHMQWAPAACTRPPRVQQSLLPWLCWAAFAHMPRPLTC